MRGIQLVQGGSAEEPGMVSALNIVINLILLLTSTMSCELCAEESGMNTFYKRMSSQCSLASWTLVPSPDY